MGLSKDQTVKLIVLSLIVAAVLLYATSPKPLLLEEGFQTGNSIPIDAENTDLTEDQIYGIVPAAASASIFKKKDARDKTANLDTLAYDKTEGKYSFDTFNVDLNPDPTDIQEILIAAAKTEGFVGADQVAATVAQSQLFQSKVQEKVQEKLATSKPGQKIGSKAVKALVKFNAKVGQKIANRVGLKVAVKLAEKAAMKIGELIGKRAATATALGIAQTAAPGGQIFGAILTAFGVVGLAAQVVVMSVLKGQDGFCPAGYERLNTQIPDFLNKIPGIGDILEVMGAYVCFRNACEPNEDEDAGLCYDKCDKGYGGIGPVCWANKTDVGPGSIPLKRACGAGLRDDGTSCWKDTIPNGVGEARKPNPCPAGHRDDGISCWEKTGQICGDDCSKGWDSCRRRGLFNMCLGGCRESCSPIERISRTLIARGTSCPGGKVDVAGLCYNPCPVGYKFAGGNLCEPNDGAGIKTTLFQRQYCNADSDLVAALCYKKCPSDTPNRVAGMPYICSSATRVGDGRDGGTSYGRGVGRPKLKLKAVQKDPLAPSVDTPANSSASFADDPNTTCKADFSSTAMMNQMCAFYLEAAVRSNKSAPLTIAYISRISKVVASSEQTCDIQCDITTMKLESYESKTPVESKTSSNETRRFYFAKVVTAKVCAFVPTAATTKNGTGKELSNPDVTPISVNFSYNPFATSLIADLKKKVDSDNKKLADAAAAATAAAAAAKKVAEDRKKALTVMIQNANSQIERFNQLEKSTTNPTTKAQYQTQARQQRTVITQYTNELNALKKQYP